MDIYPLSSLRPKKSQTYSITTHRPNRKPPTIDVAQRNSHSLSVIPTDLLDHRSLGLRSKDRTTAHGPNSKFACPKWSADKERATCDISSKRICERSSLTMDPPGSQWTCPSCYGLALGGGSWTQNCWKVCPVCEGLR